MGSRLLCRSNTVLLVVDVQGKLAQRAVGSELLHKRISALVSGCSALKVPVAFTEQLPDKLGSTSESIKAVLESALATRFVKRTFSCVGNDSLAEWNNDGLKKWLGKDKNVLLCGIEGHICVFQTCAELLEQGHRVHLIKDGTSSQRQSDLDVGIARMEKLGATISSTEMALFELMKFADMAQGSEFRTVSKLLVQ